MLIRSQDKKLLIPLEKFAIGITKDNCICATSNICVSPAEISAGLLGKYSTEEKAIKVLNMICGEYWEPFTANNVCENEVDIYVNIVFNMPQDDDLN